MEAASVLASPVAFVGYREFDRTCVSVWVSKTRSSSEMQRARARACPWRTESVLAAVDAGQTGGRIMPSAVKIMSRHMLLFVRVL